MFHVSQISEHEWEILDAAGARVGDTHSTYELAVAFLGGLLTYALAADPAAIDQAPADGLLPEAWVADLCFSQPTGDGRDFTGCVWTSRDPAVSTLPLMLQTETEYGHMGAELAGFFEEIGGLGAGTSPTGRGRFYDTEHGATMRDLLLDGRSFGVSVDPGRVEVDWVCTAEDQDGYCIAEDALFTAYEIIGVTATPFPAFAEAAIRLDSAVAASAALAPAVPRTRTPAKAATDLTRPPAAWFHTPEPEIGVRFELGSLGDEWLVDQGDGRLAMPLTITDDLQVVGHGAVWGTCHTGFPGTCVTPPTSEAAYAHFHIGETLTAEGQRLAVGALSASCDHAATHMRAPEARDHYAHNGIAWANVRVTNGVHGPWICGALRPDVTEEQLAVLRAGALSGDWRRIGGNLELVAMLAVTTPGFPIAREVMVASGLVMPAAPRVAASLSGGEQMSLVASGIVRRCPDCARRASASATQVPAVTGVDLSDIRRTLATLERRTRHLVGPAAEHAAAHIRR